MSIFVFFKVFSLTFNYCFIYSIKNLTVILYSSDTVKLGRPFIKKNNSYFLPCRVGYF